MFLLHFLLKNRAAFQAAVRLTQPLILRCGNSRNDTDGNDYIPSFTNLSIRNIQDTCFSSKLRGFSIRIIALPRHFLQINKMTLDYVVLWCQIFEPTGSPEFLKLVT
jgi:hypothetical protein